MNIIDFLNQHQIKWQPLNIIKGVDKNNKPTKIPAKVGSNPSFSFSPKTNDFKGKITENELHRRQGLIEIADYIAIDTNIIQQIDIDDPSISEEYKNKLINENPYFLSVSKKLPHIFVKLENNDLKKDIFAIDNINECLNGQWSWADKNTIIFNADNIINKYSFDNIKMPPDINSRFQESCVENIVIDEITEINVDEEAAFKFPPMKPTKEAQEISFLLSLLSEKRYKYQDWLSVGMIIKNVNESINLWIDWSKKSKYFDMDECRTKWNTFRNSGTLSLGTLKKFAKDDNPTKYNIYYKKSTIKALAYDALDRTDLSMAKMIHFMFMSELVCVDNKSQCFYRYNGVFWELDNSAIFLKLNMGEQIMKPFTDMMEETNQKIFTETDPDKKETLTKMNAKVYKVTLDLKNTGKQNNIIAQCCTLFYDKNFEDKLDNNWELFAFNNKILNITTNSFIEPNANQYISVTTGYDYYETSKEKIEELKILNTKIFADEYTNEGTAYLTYLATGLEGRTLEHVGIAHGGGGNGKSLLNELAMKTYGDYSYEGSIDTLINPIKAGVCVEVNNMNKKRFGVWGEPPIGKTFCSGTLCKLTGGSLVNARSIYSTNTNVKLHITMISECNKQPKLDDIHDGMLRRLIDIPFHCSFVSNQRYEKLKAENVDTTNLFIADKKYKSDKFKIEYRLAFFEIMREYYEIYKTNNYSIYLPDSILERNQRYLEKSDEFYTWFETRYEKTPNNKSNCVSIKDIYIEYKNSSHFNNTSKHTQRNMTEKNFKEMIKEHTLLKFYVVDRFRYKEDSMRKEKRNVLTNFRKIMLKSYDDNSEDEDEDNDENDM